jgi:hypothetical protein
MVMGGCVKDLEVVEEGEAQEEEEGFRERRLMVIQHSVRTSL